MNQISHRLKILKIILIPLALLIMLASTGCSQLSQLTSPNVKKAYDGTCYEKGKPGYDQIKAYVDFDNMRECIKTGGTGSDRP